LAGTGYKFNQSN